jgi:glycosyltransferase involved in cell wall biosynthesis
VSGRVHILFLSDVLYGTFGGAEGVLFRMTRLLPPDRYRCSIATFASRANLVAKDCFPCPVHLLPLRRTYDWQAIKVALQLSAFIRSERVSIVHTFFPISDLFGGMIARLSGCPILISSRRDMGFQRTVLHRIGYRIGRGLFDQVHTVSDRVRLRHIEDDGLRPEKVVTVHNGVDLAAIDSAPVAELSGWGVPRGSRVITLVANIRRVKGIDVMVETAAIVCRRFPDARFLVVGGVQESDYMRQVAELAERLHVTENIIFAGRHLEVPSILKACDVFYLPSRSEGLSNALLEAMACRLPCVATDVGGNAEVVAHGQSGYLTPAEDAGQAAKRIIELLQEPSLAAQMGLAGRRTVETRFTVQLMIGKLTELYEGLMADCRGEQVTFHPLRTEPSQPADERVFTRQ